MIINQNIKMSYIVLVNMGNYYATRTQEGNYIFKTYISPLMGIDEVINYNMKKNTKWAKEGELLRSMILVHQYYNKELYDKKVLESMLYSVIDKNQELVIDEKCSIILLKN